MIQNRNALTVAPATIMMRSLEFHEIVVRLGSNAEFNISMTVIFGAKTFS